MMNAITSATHAIYHLRSDIADGMLYVMLTIKTALLVSL